ncbi:MAG: sodium-dependent bicarbonate transport family permease, partial [Gammaproteobacteria bacterium]|nr:sodium-dependent bicarbonate transport family permease [Gammaproteobacteria bacterium]
MSWSSNLIDGELATMPSLDMFAGLLSTLITQLQTPTLAFLFGGMALAAVGSRFEIPDAIYRFIVVLLLLKIGIGAGLEIRDANLSALALPALGALMLGTGIVLVGRLLLSLKPGLRASDAIATAGLFGAVSSSTLAAAMVMLEDQGV